MVGLIKIFMLLFLTVSYGQQHILIGDSQTTFLSKNSIKIKRVPELSKGGIGVPYLINMVSSYPKSTNVKSVSICIGVNDRYKDRGVNELVKIVKNKFPNAKLFVIQGSWGWGGVSNMNQNNLDLYYKHFVDLGCSLITPPIGNGDPHRNKLSYREIIKNIENQL
jgi:hypothetical protein